MSRTPDSFPGQREEEDLLFITTGSLPTQDGQILYATGTISGSGFFFREAGVVKTLGMNSTQHELEFTLAHQIVSSTYDVVSYDNNSRLTQMITWADASLGRKVQQFDLQYSGSNALITAMTSSQYDSTGTLSYRILEVPTYNSRNRMVAVTRTRI